MSGDTPLGDGSRFGFVHADHESDIYTSSAGAPWEKACRAERYLAAGAPTKANELLRESREAGLEGPRLDLFEALALLSGLSIADVVAMERGRRLTELFAAHRTGGGDEGRTLRVIAALVHQVGTQGFLADPPEPESRDVREDVHALPDAYQELVGRHLDRLLTGVVHSARQLAGTEHIARGWEAADRQSRAPLFFLPDPAYPKRRFVADLDQARARSVLGGGLLVGLLASAGILMVEAARAASGVALVGVPMVLVLLALATVLLGRAQAGVRWYQATDARLHRVRPAEFADHRAQRDMAARRFHAVMRHSYEQAIDAAKPAEKDLARKWRRDTEGLRRSLQQEMIDAYGHTLRGRPESLDWLVRTQIARIKDRWQGEGFDHWCAHRRASLLVRYLGPAALAAAVLVGIPVSANLVALDPVEPLMWWLISIAVGGSAAAQIRETIAARTVHHWLRTEAGDEFVLDLQQYQREHIRVQDRPTDDEMGTWLDYDLRHVRNLALRTYSLQPSDVATHLALVEAVPGTHRARVPHGPARYRHCLVTLLLLTENGIREFRTVLDLGTGKPGDQGRLTFPYSMVVSAAVEELDRTSGKVRRVIHLDEALADDFVLPPLGDHAIRQEFVIALVQGVAARSRIEDYKDLRLPEEKRTALFELALETSGISYAMRVMEAVAVEGKDWILKEQARYRWGGF